MLFDKRQANIVESLGWEYGLSYSSISMLLALDPFSQYLRSRMCVFHFHLNSRQVKLNVRWIFGRRTREAFIRKETRAHLPGIKCLCVMLWRFYNTTCQYTNPSDIVLAYHGILSRSRNFPSKATRPKLSDAKPIRALGLQFVAK